MRIPSCCRCRSWIQPAYRCRYHKFANQQTADKWLSADMGHQCQICIHPRLVPSVGLRVSPAPLSSVQNLSAVTLQERVLIAKAAIKNTLKPFIHGSNVNRKCMMADCPHVSYPSPNWNAFFFPCQVRLALVTQHELPMDIEDFQDWKVEFEPEL